MAIYYIGYGGTRAFPKIGLLEVDCNISEDHNWKNTIPNHPVESGYSINDAIIRDPMTLTVESVVSASPIFIDRVSDKSLKRADNAYNKLVKLATTATLVSVSTGVKTYRNMAISDLSIPRKSEDGKSLRFTMSFQEVRIAKSESVINPNSDGSSALGILSTIPQEMYRTDYDSNLAINIAIPDASATPTGEFRQDFANQNNIYRIEENQPK